MRRSDGIRHQLDPKPWHPHRHLLVGLRDFVRAEAERHAHPSATVIDFGCGEKPYRTLFPASCKYLGVDVPGNPKADITYEPSGQVPVADGVADIVLSTQVLHKVVDFNHYLAECTRMLGSEGTLLISTHGTWTLHPASGGDYFRFTSDGLRTALASNGLEVESMIPIVGTLGTSIHLRQLMVDAWLRKKKLSWLAAICHVVYNFRIGVVERLTPPDAALSSPVAFAAVARPARTD